MMLHMELMLVASPKICFLTLLVLEIIDCIAAQSLIKSPINFCLITFNLKINEILGQKILLIMVFRQELFNHGH